MRVRATAVCTYGGVLREKGAVFEVALKSDLRPWMEEWNAKKAAAEATEVTSKPTGPSTMSEITKGRSKFDQ